MISVTIYTDGSCDPNPGRGGWAAILLAGQVTREMWGVQDDTTNNRMELLAAIEALKALKKPCVVKLHTDSQYLRKGITSWMAGWKRRGWKRKDGGLANADLWQELDKCVQGHKIEWVWVRGHNGDPLNERVDYLAANARLEME